MKSKLDHVYLYVSDLRKTYNFYSALFDLLGYKEFINEDWGFGFANRGISIFFEKAEDEYIKNGYHRKRIGLNHLAFKVGSKKDVDDFYRKFLKASNLNVLYDTPKLFPQYGKNYYAVFFEDPERIKLEVANY